MFIEYYRKRNAKIPETIFFYPGAGKSISLTLNKPIEIQDQQGYKILSENGDIIREADAPKKKKPKKKKQIGIPIEDSEIEAVSETE